MKNTQDILFSIIIPTYNRAHMIGKAIESVLSQTYTYWELIIIDDGSTDNTRETIAKYQDKRIKYFYQENSGKSAARNKGIELSKGEYISFLDDDDYYLEKFLEVFYFKIANENCSKGIYMCDIKEQNDNVIFELQNSKAYYDKYKNNAPLFIWLRGKGYYPFITSREVFEREKFDVRFPLGQDFHLLIRVALKLSVFYIPEPLCVIRNHFGRSINKEFSFNFESKVNRLDFLKDLLDNYFDELKKHIPTNLIFDKYNKIAYFYASTALRKKKIRYALKLMKDIKWRGTLSRVVYYKTSIFIRMFYYYFK